MSTAALQNQIYQTLKSIDDIDFLKNINHLVNDKAQRAAINISEDEWKEIEEISKKIKKDPKRLRSWETVKKNILSVKK